MSYRRYERLLLAKYYSGELSPKSADTSKSVAFKEKVTEIPKSVSSENSDSISNETTSIDDKNQHLNQNQTLKMTTSKTSTASSSNTASKISSTLTTSEISTSSVKKTVSIATGKPKARNSTVTFKSTTSPDYVSYTERFRESVAALNNTSPTNDTKSSNSSNNDAKPTTSSNSSEEMKTLPLRKSLSPLGLPTKKSSPTTDETLISTAKQKISTSLAASSTESTILNGLSSSTRSYITKPAPEEATKGKYINWSAQHAILADQPWCCIGDLMSFCDKYEFKTIALHDTRTHNGIVAEVTAMLKPGTAPFDMRKRFPGNIHEAENLWVCVGRCAAVEYHLKRILSTFRKPLDKLQPDKQRVARQNFHLSINELRLDISARISEVRLYDRNVFEKEFNLKWEDNVDD